jgi:hypothetical protein
MLIMPLIHSKPDSTRIWQMQEAVLNVYNFMKKEMQTAKAQVPKNYRMQLLKVQKQMEEATKVSK